MSNTEHPAASPEKPHVPEHVRGLEHYTGLHTRLLLGKDALNPNNTNLPDVSEASLGSFAQRDYGIFAKASNGDRKEYWQGREENNFAVQKESWVQGLVTSFQSKQEFFTQDPQGKSWGELFQKLNIDAKNFTKEQAESLYSHYFLGENTDSNVKLYVSEIIGAHYEHGVLNKELLLQNLDGIKWLANIFGENASEMVQHLVLAEIQLEDKELKEELIAASNTKEIAQGEKRSRINAINDDEKRVLSFVWKYDQAQTPQPVEDSPEPAPDTPTEEPPAQTGWQPHPDNPRRRTDIPDGTVWRGNDERGSNPREFPGNELVAHLTDPLTIAEGLKENQWQKYQDKPVETLTQEIRIEQKQLETFLNANGLTDEKMGAIALKSIQHFEEFVKNKYGVKIPDIKNITVYPISGMTSEFFQSSKGALAFVHFQYPAIFLDMEEITKAAKGLGGSKQNWEEMNQQELSNAIERLLQEIHAHEYSHLTGEVGFWRQYKKTGDQEEKTHIVIPRRGGLRMLKPRTPFKLEVERGRGLNEAVTVELTNQWARSFNAQLDINAYPEERKVLSALTTLLSEEQGISNDDAFKKFARAYFDRKSLLTLAKDLTDKKSGHDATRPHMLSTVMVLMNYEVRKSQDQNVNVTYPITLAYIQDSLTDIQKAQLHQQMRQLNGLSEPAKRALERNLTAQPLPQAA